MDEWMVGQVDEWSGLWIDGWVGGQMNGQIDGWLLDGWSNG